MNHYTYNDKYMRHFVRQSIKGGGVKAFNQYYKSKTCGDTLKIISQVLKFEGNVYGSIDAYMKFKRDHLEILEKNMQKFCASFSTMSEKLSICQKRFQVSRGTFSKKYVFFSEKIVWRSFLEVERIFFGFCWKNFGRVVETAFYVSRGTLSEKKTFFFWKKNVFIKVFDIERKIVGFFQLTFGRVVKTAFYVSIGTF